MCHKLLDKDRHSHVTDHTLYDAYRGLEAAYRTDELIAEGDFAERMQLLLQRIADEFRAVLQGSQDQQSLSRDQLTDILYRHDVPSLRKHVLEYLQHKDGLWVLVDNIDKGWPTHGLTSDDVLIIRCLLDAMNKIGRELRKKEIDGFGVVFIRNDVFDLLVDNMPDRGKTAKVSVDWDDADLLRELLRLRFVAKDLPQSTTFTSVWRQACVSHVDGEDSSQYLIDRCLMRPRALIELLGHCRSHAVNVGHAKIEVDDILRGEETFSADLVSNVSLEIRDIMPQAEDILYGFLESPAWFGPSGLNAAMRLVGVPESEDDKILDLLLWFGVVGVVRESQEDAFIYSVKYDMRRIRTLIQKKPESERVFCINKAFWAGLEVKRDG